MRIRIKRNKSTMTLITDVLCAGSMLLQVLQISSREAYEMFYYPAIMMGGLLFLYEMFFYKKRRQVMMLLFAFLIIAVCNMVIVGNTQISYILKFYFLYFPNALYLFYGRKKNRYIWCAAAIFVFIYVEYLYLFSGNMAYISVTTSRNYVSFYLLLSFFLYSIVTHIDRKHFGIFSIAYLALCVIGVGRSGIIMGLSFYLVYFVYSIFKDKNTKRVMYRKLAYVILILSIALVFALNFDFILQKYFPRFVDATARASNIGRLSLYSEYIRECFSSFKNFMFGVNVSSIMYKYPFAHGNLHNSFLQLHSNLGIVGLLFVVCILFKVLFIAYKKDDYVNLSIVVAFFIKMMFDFVIGGYVGDIILIYYILYYLNNQKEKKIINAAS